MNQSTGQTEILITKASRLHRWRTLHICTTIHDNPILRRFDQSGGPTNRPTLSIPKPCFPTLPTTLIHHIFNLCPPPQCFPLGVRCCPATCVDGLDINIMSELTAFTAVVSANTHLAGIVDSADSAAASLML